MARQGLKTDVKRDMFWSEICSGFGELTGRHNLTKSSQKYPPGLNISRLQLCTGQLFRFVSLLD